VRQHLSNTTESNISENNEWKSFQLSLCICAMYFTWLSKHFLSISFDAAWLIAYFTAFIKHKHWIQIWHVCLLHKTCPIQTNSVSFHQPNIWKKIESVHVCLVLKTCVPLLLYEVGPEIWKIYCFFRWNREPWTILSTICVPLNCDPKIIRMRPTSGLLLITESNIASLACYSFYVLILYLFINQISKI